MRHHERHGPEGGSREVDQGPNDEEHEELLHLAVLRSHQEGEQVSTPQYDRLQAPQGGQTSLQHVRQDRPQKYKHAQGPLSHPDYAQRLGWPEGDAQAVHARIALARQLGILPLCPLHER